MTRQIKKSSGETFRAMGKLFQLALCTSVLSIGFVHFASADDSIYNNKTLLGFDDIQEYSIPDALPLAWEKNHPERKQWSDYVYSVVDNYFYELNRARDIRLLCGNYKSLSYPEQVQAWAQVFVGISYYESSWSPLNRSFEDQGIDPITDKPVYSEGLLQLSYQDVQSNPYCDFDWQKDKDLSIHDVRRSILNPYNNLYCGIRIMADIVAQNKRAVVKSGGYWSTFSPYGSEYSQLKKIQLQETQTLPFCGLPSVQHSLFQRFLSFLGL